VLKSPICRFFDQEPKEHETGSIESDGDPRRWIQGSQDQNGDFRNSQVHLIHVFSLSANVTFLCKLRRIHVIVRNGIHVCYYSGHREHFRWNLGNLRILVGMVF